MNMKRCASFVLALVLICGCVGCGSAKTDGSFLTVWAEHTTVKIKQQDDGKAAKSAGSKNVLKISMAKNESEGIQLMMRAKKDVSAYTVMVSDMKCENEVIPADDIEIYMLKYQTVEILQPTGNDAFPAGSKIPDPMLPMETAITYGENTIKKGNNQAVYFDVTTTKDTRAGLYKGNVTVKVGKENYIIPMQVTVHDVTLPDTPGLKTAFSYMDRDLFATAELDASDEMTASYFETLMNYNMGSFLPFEGVGGVEKYLELLKKYWSYPGFTCYRLYYDPSGSVYNGVPCSYNAPLLKEFVRGIARLSVTDKTDYLSKAYCYFYTVADEPSTDEQFQIAKAAIDTYKAMLTDCDAELRLEYAGTADYEYYIEVVSNSLLELPNVLPGSLFKGELEKYGISDYTMVPLIDNFQSDASRKASVVGRENKELWTYTCNFPVYPYPSSHVDDYNLGLRLTSWMCCDYDWDGFLQWRSIGNVYGTVGGSAVADSWEEVNTAAGRPGEGIYFYPGKKYGLSAPCPSIRAVIYRDGTEDYELLKAIEKIYLEKGMDADAALQQLYDKVFSGVIPITDSYVFEDVRAELFQMIADLNSSVGILYKSIDMGYDNAEIIFKCTDENAKATVDDKELKKDKDGLYNVCVDLKKQAECKIIITCGKDVKEYIKKVSDGILDTICGFEDGGKPTDYLLISKNGNTAELNKTEKYVLGGKQSLHLMLNTGEENKIPYFGIDKSSKLIGGDWNDISGMRFYIYNASPEEVIMESVYFTTSEIQMDTYALAAEEWTMIQINMPKGLVDVESIQEFDFNFKEGSSADLYLDNFVTISKGEKQK